MIFHLKVLLWTLVFWLGLEALLFSPLLASWNWYFLSVLILLAVAAFSARRLTKRLSDGFLPGLLAIVAPLLLLLIDSPAQRQVFIVISALMYYSALLAVYRLKHAPEDRTAFAFLSAAAMAALFFFYAGLYGFYLNFSFPLWGLMLLFFFGTAVTSFQLILSSGAARRRQGMIYSLILGLIMGEMVWVMSFWPFGYLTTGAMGLIFFFLSWDIALDGLRHTLSLKRAVVRIIFFACMVALLLATTPWRILV